MTDWRLRLRVVFSEQFTVVVVVLLVTAAAGGWMTYTAYAAPDTTAGQQESASWEMTGSFDHGATVVRDSTVFSAGTTLTDRPVYFTQLSPELNGTFTTGYDASNRGHLNQTVSLSLVMREVDERGQGEEATVHWETSEQLNTATVDSVRPGESVTVPFVRNMSAVEADRNRIQNELGGSAGETEVFIRAVVDSSGTVDGNAVDETTRYTLPVTFGDSTYSVGEAEPTVEQYGPAQPATVDETSGSMGSVGGPLLLVVSLGLLIGFVAIGRPERLSERERARLSDERDRETFDEWISTIKLPADAFELPRAEAASLGELVDLAIDTDNRVIEDPDDGRYYVRHDGYLYHYRPDSETTASDETTGEHTESAIPDTGSTEPNTDSESAETTDQ